MRTTMFASLAELKAEKKHLWDAIGRYEEESGKLNDVAVDCRPAVQQGEYWWGLRTQDKCIARRSRMGIHDNANRKCAVCVALDGYRMAYSACCSLIDSWLAAYQEQVEEDEEDGMTLEAITLEDEEAEYNLAPYLNLPLDYLTEYLRFSTHN